VLVLTMIDAEVVSVICPVTAVTIGQTDRQTDRDKHRGTARQTDRQTEEKMDRHTNRQTDSQTNERKYGQRNTQTDGQMERQRLTHRQTNEQTDRQTATRALLCQLCIARLTVIGTEVGRFVSSVATVVLGQTDRPTDRQTPTRCFVNSVVLVLTVIERRILLTVIGTEVGRFVSSVAAVVVLITD